MKQLKYLAVFSIFIFGIGAGFAPWVFRAPIALQLTAPNLAEYVKFLGEVRLGQLAVQRLHFLFPAMLAALAFPLLAANRQLRLHWGLSGLLRVATVPMALVFLSPVWSPGILLNAEFRVQTFVAILAIALAIFSPLLKALPLKWLLGAIALIALLSTILALRQFFVTQNAIALTYASPVHLGWGGWLTILGAVGLIASTHKLCNPSD